RAESKNRQFDGDCVGEIVKMLLTLIHFHADKASWRSAVSHVSEYVRNNTEFGASVGRRLRPAPLARSAPTQVRTSDGHEQPHLSRCGHCASWLSALGLAAPSHPHRRKREGETSREPERKRGASFSARHIEDRCGRQHTEHHSRGHRKC